MTALRLAPEPDDRDSQLTEIVAAIHRLDAERARIDEQRALYAGKLLDLLPDGTTTIGNSKVIVTRPRRFNAAAFQSTYGPESNPALYVPALDRKKAGAWLELTGTDPAPFYTAGKRQVTVR